MCGATFSPPPLTAASVTQFLLEHRDNLYEVNELLIPHDQVIVPVKYVDEKATQTRGQGHSMFGSTGTNRFEIRLEGSHDLMVGIVPRRSPTAQLVSRPARPT